MRCLLVYDIPHDGIRGKIADVCLDYGLDRIQFSAFIGVLRASHQDELMLKLKRILGKQPGKILLFGINAADWDARKEIIQVADDKSLKPSGLPQPLPATDHDEDPDAI
jgi:CRISPR-associated protein Cas2